MTSRLLHLISHRQLRVVQQSPRLFGLLVGFPQQSSHVVGLQERAHEDGAVLVGRGVGQGFTQAHDVLPCGLEGADGEDQVVLHAASVEQATVGEKPNSLDTDLGRPVFWKALAIALLVWALWTDFALVQSILASCGVLLGVAVQLVEAQRQGVERRIREALTLSGYSIKSAAAAYWGDADRAPDFEKALRGFRPLDLPRLEILLGDEFARHFSMLTLIEKGPPTYIRQALKVMPEGAL